MRNPYSDPQRLSWREVVAVAYRALFNRGKGAGGRLRPLHKWMLGGLLCALAAASISLGARAREHYPNPKPGPATASASEAGAKTEAAAKAEAAPSPTPNKSGERKSVSPKPSAESPTPGREKTNTGVEPPKPNEGEASGTPGKDAGATAQQELATSQTQANTAGPEQEGADFLRKRAEWFYNQRAYPLKRIPPGMREKALEHLDRMIEAQKARQAVASTLYTTAPSGSAAAAATPEVITFPGPSTWTQIGPQPAVSPQFGNVSGRVNAIATDLKSSATVFLGAAEGGVWKTTNGGTNWTPVTDQAPSLAISSLAIDPNSCAGASCTTIYAGTGEENFNIDSYFGAGILKSTDGGTTWNLACSTAGPSCPFVGGPFASTVGGTKVGAIAVQPGNGNVVLAAMTIVDGGTTGGIFRSADGGATWSHVILGAAGTDVVFESTSVASATAATAYAAMGDAFGDTANGIYKSTDSGQTWTKMSGSGLPATGLGRIQLGYAANTSGAATVLYASIGNSATSSSTLLGLFKSSAGASPTGAWTTLTVTGAGVIGGDYCTGQCFYDMPIKVDPTNANNVFVGGSAFNANQTSLFRSLDGGTTWSDVSAVGDGHFLHVDHHALAFSTVGTATLYDGNDGGVWSSTNFTTATPTWNNLNSTLAISQFYPGNAVNPSNENDGFGGTQDNSMLEFSGIPSWNQVTCGDGGSALYDRNVPTDVYVNCTVLNPPYIRKSFLGGSAGTYLAASNGINPADAARTPFIPKIGIDRNIAPGTLSGAVLYTATYRVYQSIDGANNWVPISPDLSANGVSGISAGDISRADSNVIYAGTQDGQIWRTTNGSPLTTAQGNQIWTNLTKAPLPARSITSIYSHSSDPNTVFVAYSGFSGFGADVTGHVFKSTNGGITWTDVSCHAANCGTPGVNDLPNIPVNFVVFDESHNIIYVGTDIGVFSSSDGGSTTTTWAPVGSGLPRVAVLGADVGRRSGIVHLGTHGRSMWVFQLPGFTPPSGPFLSSITPGFVTVNSPATTITVDGANFTASSAVEWDGATNGISTTFASANRLTALIPASLLANSTSTLGSTHSVTVVDTTQTPNTSQQLTFVVLGTPPTLTSISPTSGPSDTGFTMTANGSGFAAGSSIVFNGHIELRTPGETSSTLMTASIPATAVNTEGAVPVDVMNGGPGGGPTGTPQTFTIVAAGPPAISSLTPSSVNAGGPGFNLSVGGSNFFTNSVVNLGGVAHPTTYISSSTLVVAVSATDTAAASSVPITVTNPISGTSAPMNLMVNMGSNPLPSVISLFPNPEHAATDFTLSVNGTNFLANSVVNVNGVPRATTFLSSTGLSATVSAAEIAIPGTVAITVSNPLPGGGTSTPAVNLTVSNGIPSLSSISPNSVPAGTPGGPLKVAGSNFTGQSVVNFNGSARTTTLVNSGELIAQILTSDLATAGTFPITVTNPGTGGGTSGPVTLTVTGTGTPASMTANAGTTPQSATINTAFANALAVTVKDAGGNPVSGVSVTFTAPGSGASGKFSNSTATITVATNASGVASAAFTANATAGGPYTVTAMATGLTTVSFSLTNNAGTATTMTANAGTTPQSATINTAFANALAVTVKDAGGNPVSGVSVTFAAPGSGASGTFSNSTATITVATNASGVASAAFTANATAGGPYTVTAMATGLTTVSFSLTNLAGSATSIATTTGTPQSVAINMAFTTNLQVSVTDGFGNGVSGVLITFTVNPAANGASGAFTGGNTAMTNAQGVATANTLTANAITGSYTVTASASGITGTATFALTNLAGPPATITATSGTPQTVQLGAAFATLKALVKDSGGNPVSGANVTFTAPATGASGTFTGGSNVGNATTDATGTASAPAFSANFTNGGPYNVNATVMGVNTPATFSLTNTALAPSVNSLSPPSATAGGVAFNLTVNGANFATTSVVNFNGAAKSTTFLNSTQLTAAITAADIAAAGTVNVTVTTPAPGGGTSAPPTQFTINNPLPTISTLAPNNATAGGISFALTVTGTNFVATSVVNFNGAAKTTMFNSSTSLTATITATDIANGGVIVPVTVMNPGPGGGTSTPAAQFTINNAQPVISSLSPANALAGGAAFQLTVNSSTNTFVSGAVVSFNGAAKTTTFVSSTQLKAAITAADIATAGGFNVIVTNPAPAVGPSAAFTFTVNNPVPTIASGTVGGANHAPGGTAFTLTVTGTNFASGTNETSVVNFNGKAEPTTFVSATQVTASIPATDVATAVAGTSVNVTVTNPTPGGGTTATSTAFAVDGYTLTGPASPVTVTAGQTASIPIVVKPSANGFSNQVMFSVTGLPMHAALTPLSVTPGNTQQTVNLMITTVAGAATPPTSPMDHPLPPLLRFLLVTWIAVLLAGLYAARLIRRTPRLKPYAAIVPLALLLISGAVLAGCASGMGMNGGTPKGSSQLTITATSGTVAESTQATLTVQ